MSVSILFVLCLAFGLSGVCSVPFVFKESTPNGESVIAISSSDPEVEKYWLNKYTSQQINPDASLLRSNLYGPEGRYSGQSFSGLPGYYNQQEVTKSRKFAEPNPFLVPFMFPNLDAFQLNNWFRNIEAYDRPEANFGGSVRTVAVASGNNGQAYAKVESRPSKKL